MSQGTDKKINEQIDIISNMIGVRTLRHVNMLCAAHELDEEIHDLLTEKRRLSKILTESMAKNTILKKIEGLKN